MIFGLLYLTYHSALEAAHVLMAVPFALTGGVYLVWLLGYNFSVAVWVGFIALFGTAVQTAVVMVIYLNESVHKKRDEVGRQLTPKGTDAGRDRRRVAASAAKGDDRLDRCRRTVADHVEFECRFGGDETARRAGLRRNGFEFAACFDNHAGDLLLD